MSVPHIIYLEGIPGASKTSQGRLLAAQNPRVNFFAEPMEQWTLFSKMCENPSQFTASAQTQIILSVYKTTLKAIESAREDPNAIVVMERSLADPSLFSKQSLSAGNITTDEYTTLCSLANEFISLLPQHTFSVLYLTASAETMLKRVEHRNRPGEGRLDMKYMTYMNEVHDNFYSNERDNIFQVCVIRGGVFFYVTNNDVCHSCRLKVNL